jgi:hypothetical protein
MRRDDRHAVLDGVEPMQRAERVVSVFVREPSWIAGLLADVVDLVGVPCGVAREQHGTGRGVQQHSDAAGGVSGEVDDDDRTVAEQIVAAGEGQDRSPTSSSPTSLTVSTP